MDVLLVSFPFTSTAHTDKELFKDNPDWTAIVESTDEVYYSDVTHPFRVSEEGQYIARTYMENVWIEGKNASKHIPGTKYTVFDAERLTRGQRENVEWLGFRYGRVTGSVCGQIMQAESYGPQGKLKYMPTIAFRMLHPQPFATEAISWGLHNEPVAVEEYRKVFPKELGYDVQVNQGLHVHPDKPWIAVSPDGVVEWRGERMAGDKEAGYKKLLLEVKCPFSQRYDPDFNAKGFYLKEVANSNWFKYELDMTKVKARGYYWQMQLSMAVMDLELAHLFVWTPTKSEVIEVKRQSPEDEAKMFNVLDEFHWRFMRFYINPLEYRYVIPMINPVGGPEDALVHELMSGLNKPLMYGASSSKRTKTREGWTYEKKEEEQGEEQMKTTSG